MNPDWRIVPLERAHLAAVAELEKAVFAEPWSEKALELLLSAQGVGFVAVRDGEVLAYGGMIVAVDEGQISNVAVRADQRRRGLGRAVLGALNDEAKSRGLVQISLEARVSNVAAIALYESMGYEVLGKRKKFYRHPVEDAFVMVKTL